MRYFKLFLHCLGVPFVFIALLWRFLFIKKKYRKYANNPSSYPKEDRYLAVYKLAKNYLYIKNIKYYSTGFSDCPTVPALYLCNHKSAIDPVIMFCRLYETPNVPYFRFVAKQESNKGRIAYAFKLIDTIFIDRTNLRQNLEIFKNEIKPKDDKRSIVVFVEGTRVYENNNIGEFHSGSVKLGYDHFLPIIPVVISGSSGLNSDDKNKKFKNKNKQVFLTCLKPIVSTKYMTIQIISFTEQLKDLYIKELNRINDIVQKCKHKYVDSIKKVYEYPDGLDEGDRY